MRISQMKRHSLQSERILNTVLSCLLMESGCVTLLMQQCVHHELERFPKPRCPDFLFGFYYVDMVG